MRLLYITFGPGNAIHAQAHFSILSFLRFRHTDTHVLVMTDQPALYQRFGALIQIRPVDTKQLEDWKGEHHFFWRIKIKAMEQMVADFPGEDLMYMDTDTFARNDVDDLFTRLRKGEAFMHVNEGPLSRLRTKTERKMWRQVTGKSFGGVTIHDRHEMWNAGVVAVPGEQAARIVASALAICDDMCRAKVTPRLIEQFALALALQTAGGLRAAEPYIAHYWGNKPEWNDALADFFLAHYFRDSTVAEQIAWWESFQTTAPAMHRRRSSLHRKIIRLADVLFPFK